MIRFLFRSLGVLLLASAFAALIVDATRSIAGGRILLFRLADTAHWLAPSALASLQQAAATHGVGAALDGLTELPTWLACGIAGGLLVALGRRPPVRDRRR